MQKINMTYKDKRRKRRRGRRRRRRRKKIKKDRNEVRAHSTEVCLSSRTEYS